MIVFVSGIDRSLCLALATSIKPDQVCPLIISMFSIKEGETTELSGIAIANMLADPNIMAKTGKIVWVCLQFIVFVFLLLTHYL